MIREFQSNQPQLGQNVYISENASVIGNVTLGDEVNIWFGSVLRGDMHYIKIGNRSNVQDNSVVHVTTALSPVNIGSGVTVGHGAIIHGANLGRNCLIGMNTVIMDDAEIGDESIIGAMAFVKAETKIPPRSLVVGNPAKVIKQVSDDMIAWKTKGTQLYQQLPADCHNSLKAVEPLREVPDDMKMQEDVYKTLRETFKK